MMRKAFVGLRCVLCITPDVVVMKMHDCVIGSHTGLRMMIVGAGVLAVLLLACAGTAAGATWVVDDDGGVDHIDMQTVESHWHMFQHDAQHTGRSAYSGPQDSHVRWTFDDVEEAIHGPAVGEDGTIYLTARKLYAINPEGELKWLYEAGGVNAPVVRDEVVYVISQGGALRH